jgi:hypothetical protein
MAETQFLTATLAELVYLRVQHRGRHVWGYSLAYLSMAAKAHRGVGTRLAEASPLMVGSKEHIPLHTLPNRRRFGSSELSVNEIIPPVAKYTTAFDIDGEEPLPANSPPVPPPPAPAIVPPCPQPAPTPHIAEEAPPSYWESSPPPPRGHPFNYTSTSRPNSTHSGRTAAAASMRSGHAGASQAPGSSAAVLNAAINDIRTQLSSPDNLRPQDIEGLLARLDALQVLAAPPGTQAGPSSAPQRSAQPMSNTLWSSKRPLPRPPSGPRKV